MEGNMTLSKVGERNAAKVRVKCILANFSDVNVLRKFNKDSLKAIFFYKLIITYEIYFRRTFLTAST